MFVSCTSDNPENKIWGCPNYKAYIIGTNDVINVDGCCFVGSYIVHACFCSVHDLVVVGCYDIGFLVVFKCQDANFYCFDGNCNVWMVI
uniref:Uncharacterized protein n=1 Tax=Lactuca sativa TaxID=4236 RepID=A0A9R1XME4_LACSA|nr:hypothetical protein LSAT_V11C200071020 [Lactuca sativa]